MAKESEKKVGGKENNETVVVADLALKPEIQEAEEVLEVQKEEITAEVFLTIDDFLATVPGLTKVLKKYHRGNNNTSDMRTAEEWKIITKLN